MARVNQHESREAWLRTATDDLRPFFIQLDYPLPDKIRFAIAFTSRGKKGRVAGECWHASASADDHHEIIIRADFSDPLEVLGILAHELVHAALPLGAKHGKLYKAAAARIGLEGKMIHALPGPVLQERLAGIASILGPLPHARLNFLGEAGDRPKKQKTRMLKAECGAENCGFTVRLARQWVVEVGPPHCPKHGPMSVEMPDAEEDQAAGESV